MYYLSIGDPWDFESPDGKNIINGEVIKFIDSNCIIFKANYTLQIDDTVGDVIILTPRYADENFDGLGKESYRVTVNGGLLSEFDEDMGIEELKLKSKFFITGGLNVKDK